MLSPDHSEKLFALLKKYNEGHASEEEKAFVELYYDYFKTGQDGYQQLSEEEKQNMEASLWGKVGKRIEEIQQREEPAARIPAKRKLLFRTLSAAAALIVLLGAVYLFSRPEKKPAPSPALAKYLVPGGNKAVLTLGDGTKITLDSTAKGLISQQGNVRIVKTATDELSYQTSTGPGNTVSYNTMETPRGGQYRLSLPDGTKVWLNSASSIRYPNIFTGDRRSVEITGEAYFEVANDSKRPFTVMTGNMQVQVLGTAFNLMAYTDEEEIQTTLVTGAVIVKKDLTTQVLKPGQQAILANGSSSFRTKEPDMGSVLAWKDGYFKLDNKGIATIMRQLARWYDVEIVYEGTPPAEQFIGSLPRQENAAEILNALELTKNVHFRVEGKRIVVIAGPKKKSHQ